MIVIFHSVYLFTRYVYSLLSLSALAVFNERDSGDEIDLSNRNKYQVQSETDFEEGRGPRFFPQLYVQRYSTVKRVLEDEKWKGKIKKVVDFGCAEFGFFQYLKKLEGCHEILEVDIDQELLEQHCCRVTPLNCDFLNQRSEPLTVYVLQGSVTHPDNYLLGCDAVVCIELIEHLYPEVLEDLPYNVFGFIKPLIAIFTTPNEEFNVLFTDFSGFRHPDHKFEWTRSQFECWANNLVTRYPDYTVSFHDIGEGLPGNQCLGGCSQMAVFERSNIISEGNEDIKPQVEESIRQYKLVRKCEFPFFVDSRSDRTRIRDQAEYYIHFLSSSEDLLVDDRPQVPLTSLLQFVSKWTSSIDELAEILEENRWELVKHHSGCLAVLYPENKSTSEDEENVPEESFINEGNQLEEEMENWDTPSNFHFENDSNEYGDWACDYADQNLKDTGVPWTDENEIKEHHITASKSEPTLKSWIFLENEGINCSTLPSSKSDSKVGYSESLPNVPSYRGPIIEKKSIAFSSYPHRETIFPKSQVADSSIQNILFSGMTEDCCSVPTNKQYSVIEREDLPKFEDLYRASEVTVENSIIFENDDPTHFVPDFLDKSVNHVCNSHFQPYADIQPHILKCNPSNKLCLNLQLDGQNASILESTKKLDGPSDSPIACSFSLDEPNDRQADSGYPNSTSAQDMDLDLTPEQVDELFTENDVVTDQPLDQHLDSISISSRDSDSLSEPELEPLQMHPPVIVPLDMLFEEDMNVENGDVANNNRDGEGNNAVAVVPELLDGLEGNDNNAGGGGAVLPENFDIIPLIAAAEDLDNDNEIELNVVEPFPPWLLNLLGLANGGGIGGRDRGIFEDDDHSSDDDSDNNIDAIDEGLREDDN